MNKTPSEFNSNQPSKLAESTLLRSAEAKVTPVQKQEKHLKAELNGSQLQTQPKKRFTVAALSKKRMTVAEPA